MKVLLDENLPHQLRRHLRPNDVYTTSSMGWSGWENGELLTVAEDVGFEIFVTGDLSIEYQLNLAGRRIALVSLSTTNWRVLKPYVERIATAVNTAEPGRLIHVDCGRFSRRPPQGLSPN